MNYFVRLCACDYVTFCLYGCSSNIVLWIVFFCLRRRLKTTNSVSNSKSLIGNKWVTKNGQQFTRWQMHLKNWRNRGVWPSLYQIHVLMQISGWWLKWTKQINITQKELWKYAIFSTNWSRFSENQMKKNVYTGFRKENKTTTTTDWCV